MAAEFEGGSMLIFRLAPQVTTQLPSLSADAANFGVIVRTKAAGLQRPATKCLNGPLVFSTSPDNASTCFGSAV